MYISIKDRASDADSMVKVVVLENSIVMLDGFPQVQTIAQVQSSVKEILSLEIR